MKKERGVFIKLLLIFILSTFLLTGCVSVEKEESIKESINESTNETTNETTNESPIQTVFTITFDSDGGRKVQSQEKLKNELVEEPNLTYKIVYNDGEYELEGWYFGEIKWDFDTMKVTKDMVLKARWNKVENYPKPEI